MTRLGKTLLKLRREKGREGKHKNITCGGETAERRYREALRTGLIVSV